jgi:dTDP-4-amino-4,6-dideoxygalactose transaminase
LSNFNSYKTISAFPNINPSLFFYSNNICNDPVLNRAYLYSSGRAAIYFGLKALNLPPDSTIIAPSYNCSVEINSIVYAGYSVKFYSLGLNLKVDLQEIKSLLSPDSRALMVIHYFGFPQPMEEIVSFCREYGLILIEDCAHALYSKYSGRFLGDFGDIATFSLRKTLPLPNGGCLLVNSNRIKVPEAGQSYESFILLKSMFRSLLNFYAFRASVVGKLSRSLIDKWELYQSDGRSTPDNKTCKVKLKEKYADSRYGYTKQISILSKAFLGKEKFSDVVHKRRRNYRMLVSQVVQNNKFNFFFNALPQGVCPLCCVAEIKKNRDLFVDKLKQYGVEAYVFGRHPYHLFSDGNNKNGVCWSDNLVGLPIHQQIGRDELKMIINAVNKCVDEL